MEIAKIAIEKINPAPYNPRQDLKPGDPDYEKLRKSLEEFDCVEPLVWNKRTGHLVGGHQRLKVLKARGDREVMVSVVDLPLDKEKALNLALNKIQGDWDMPKLKDLLEEIDTGAFDIEITGFDEEEIEDLMTQFYVAPETEEDDFNAAEEVEKIKEPETKPGELILLGRHRLLCGDSTKIESINLLLGDHKADMAFTDPPYNLGYVPETRPIGGRAGSKKKLGGISNDVMEREAFITFLSEAFGVLDKALKPGGAIYICHADSQGLVFRQVFEAMAWNFASCIIWVKNNFSIGRSDYHWQHESILYGWKQGASHQWYGDRSQTTVWNIDRVASNKYEHPTQKPVVLAAKAIKNSSKGEDIVLDTFLGSGTTLIAAEQLGRRCFGIELDPRYCDVTVARWERFTGQKAERQVAVHAV